MISAKITLTLNKAQRKGNNKWDVTIQGEPRTVTQQKVVFYVDDHKLVMSSFKPEEVLQAKVKINFAQ